MKRILVVDDEKNIRLLFQHELEEEGYEVDTASGGGEALEKLEKQLPDIVVLDVRMEDMTGLEVLEEIRRKYGDGLPVIMCTAVRGLEDDFTMWDNRVSDYITKPVDLDDLKGKIKKILSE